jgi:hypothetical protein
MQCIRRITTSTAVTLHAQARHSRPLASRQNTRTGMRACARAHMRESAVRAHVVLCKRHAFTALHLASLCRNLRLLNYTAPCCTALRHVGAHRNILQRVATHKLKHAELGCDTPAAMRATCWTVVCHVIQWYHWSQSVPTCCTRCVATHGPLRWAMVRCVANVWQWLHLVILRCHVWQCCTLLRRVALCCTVSYAMFYCHGVTALPICPHDNRGRPRPRLGRSLCVGGLRADEAVYACASERTLSG